MSNCTASAGVLLQQYSDCHDGLTTLGIVLASVGAAVTLLVAVLSMLALLVCVVRQRRRKHARAISASASQLHLSQAELTGLYRPAEDTTPPSVTPELFQALHATAEDPEQGSSTLRRTVRKLRLDTGSSSRAGPRWFNAVYRASEPGKMGFSQWSVHLPDTSMFTCSTHTLKIKNKDSVRLRVVMGTYDPVHSARLRIIFVPQEVTLKPGEAADITIDVMPVVPEDARLLLSFQLYAANGSLFTPYYLPFRCRGMPLTSERMREFSWEELSGGQPVGRGAAGVVYRLTLPGTGTVVAVKKFNAIRLDQSELQEFVSELRLLSRIHHPCVVRLLGRCIEVHTEPRLALVMEYIEFGSLGNLLHPLLPDSQQIELSWQLRLKFALDATRAMAFLHRNGVLHRDIKSDNFLVASVSLDAAVNIKVADFSIGKDLRDRPDRTSAIISPGTDQYKALEVLQDAPAMRESDVWSFGVVLWEMATRRLPYTEVRSHEIHDRVKNGLRLPPLEPETLAPFGYEHSMRQCWENEPARRPTFDMLAARLTDMQSANGWRLCDTRDVNFDDPDEDTGEDQELEVDEVF
jgi:tRNA A-37 threonylcarbamoyl transferase component Bud32